MVFFFSKNIQVCIRTHFCNSTIYFEYTVSYNWCSPVAHLLHTLHCYRWPFFYCSIASIYMCFIYLYFKLIIFLSLIDIAKKILEIIQWNIYFIFPLHILIYSKNDLITTLHLLFTWKLWTCPFSPPSSERVSRLLGLQ